MADGEPASVGTSHETAGLAVTPLPDAPFGAEINGLNPTRMSEAQRAVIWETYAERRGLLCFSFERLLEAEELHALTAVFGENEFAPGKINGIGKGTPEGEEDRTVEVQVADLRARGEDPYLAFIGNLNPQTLEPKPTNDAFYGEWEWHSDMSYIEVPPTFSLLHSRVIPSNGGDTGFCSQVMAARELPPELRERVRGRGAKHDSTYGSSGLLRQGMAAPETPVEAIGQVHPILRRVPTTGEGRRTNGYIDGLPLEESEALLDEVWAHATQEQFCYRHNWRVGQVVVWDNRMLLHMRHPVPGDEARFMWRTQTKGEPVVASEG